MFVRLQLILCLAGECPCFRHCCKTYTFVFKIIPMITIVDVAVLGECCALGHDYSLNSLVLVFISDALYMSQSFSIITFVFELFFRL